MSHQAVVEIPLDKIDCVDQIREEVDETKLDHLVASIQANGQLHPPRVLPKGEGRFEVLIGHRRILAQRKAGVKAVAVIVHDKPLSEAEKLKIQLAENADRVDLNPLEEARAVLRFMEASGLNATDTAKELNLSITDVSRYRERVEEWSAELQESVANGKICPATAHHIHKVNVPERQQQLIRQAAEGQLTRDAAAGLAKKQKTRAKQPEGRHRTRVRIVLDEVTSVTVCAPALTLDSLIKELKRVLNKARKGLAQGLELNTFERTCQDSAAAGQR
jgi:ParB/RepB/Spo0J family partition protein